MLIDAKPEGARERSDTLTLSVFAFELCTLSLQVSRRQGDSTPYGKHTDSGVTDVRESCAVCERRVRRERQILYDIVFRQRKGL